jgi:hypothetical protein
VPKKISVKALGKGLTVQVSSNEDVSIEASLIGVAKTVRLGGKANVLLAQQSLGFGSDGVIVLKPKSKLLRGAGSFKAEVRITATDRSGDASKIKQKVKVKG